MLKTYFNWSSGKDSSLALYYALQSPEYKINRLVTTVNSAFNRVSMHGLRKELLERQAETIGIPLSIIELPEKPTMEEYGTIMESKVHELKKEGFTDTVFGDIFLEDLRQYREEQLKKHDINCHFPLWKRDTRRLIKDFINLDFKAVVVCVNGQLLDESFVGREINENFLNDLPNNVDPCGENGEFHTFCYDGPIFNEPVAFSIGEKVFREYENPSSKNEICETEKMGFWFCDLLLS